MISILERIAQFIKSFWPLFTVLAWENAVLVRFGKRVSLLLPGVHFRIPFFDAVSIVNTRLRIVHTEPQTLTTKDGRALVVSATIGFRISDPLAAALRHHQPEWAVRSIAIGLIAERIAGAASADLSPSIVSTGVLAALRANGGGYDYDICTVGEWGYLRTIRLMQSSGSPYSPTIEERKV